MLYCYYCWVPSLWQYNSTIPTVKEEYNTHTSHMTVSHLFHINLPTSKNNPTHPICPHYSLSIWWHGQWSHCIFLLDCDIADNSKSKYGSGFLVLEMLLHYGGPIGKTASLTYVQFVFSSKQSWQLLTTIQWHQFKRLCCCLKANSFVFQIRGKKIILHFF